MSIMLHITYNYALQTLCGAPHNVCNEEGKINGLPLNRYVPSIQDVICGTFFVCDGSEEEFQTLPDEDMKKIQEQFHSPEYFWNQYGTLFIHRCRPDEYDKLMAKHR
jgi:hypothetical protein